MPEHLSSPSQCPILQHPLDRTWPTAKRAAIGAPRDRAEDVPGKVTIVLRVSASEMPRRTLAGRQILAVGLQAACPRAN